MTIPVAPKIGALVLVTTGFYMYVGQMVPQNEVLPPVETIINTNITTPEMVELGREISEGKGLCTTCHTIGQTGALRFPDLGGIGGRANTRIPGLSDVEYLAESLYEPDSYIVEGFNPGMPTISAPPIDLTDEEILVVIAYLQSLGGTPTVTLQTAHRYYTPEGAAPVALSDTEEEATPSAEEIMPDAAETTPVASLKNFFLRPDAATQDMMRGTNTGDSGTPPAILAAAGVLVISSFTEDIATDWKVTR